MELMLGGVLPVVVLVCVKQHIFIEVEDTEVKCVVYLFVFHLCDETIKSIRACWGGSYTKLCCKYESYSRYCCLQGSVRWNRMKSTAVVSQTHTWSYTQHTNRHPNYSVSVPSWLWLIQTYTQAQIPTQLDKEIHIFICRSSGGKREPTPHLLVCIFQLQLTELFARKSDDGI